MPERADLLGRDMIPSGPIGEQIVDRELQLSRPLSEVAQGEAVGAVMPIVAGVLDRGCDVPGFCEGDGSVVMSQCTAAGPV